jgi:putative ABC transport system substrate-binding protein
VINRRAFLGAAVGGSLVLEFAAWAQPTARITHVGYLGTSSPALDRHLIEVFLQKLRDLGFVEGQNLMMEYRWADGNDDRLPALAVQLVHLSPDIIVTSGTPGTIAAMHATKTIPIVMTSSSDPVRIGLVASLAHPGGNVTGLSIEAPELEGKRLELIYQLLPSLSRLGVLWNASNPATKPIFEQTQATAARLRVALEPIVEVGRVEELDPGLETIAKQRPGALLILPDRLLLAHRERIIGFLAKQRLPAMYSYREYVEDGGLISYAPSDVAQFRGAAFYVDKIIKGAKPADLPVQQPTAFELVINLKTAKALGLTIPQSLLLRADEVIQ